jgi:hypothetical protein
VARVARPGCRRPADEICTRLESIADNLEAIPALVVKAYQDGDWETLGYEDWETYVQRVYKTNLIRIDKATRKVWSRELTAAGMSSYEIAPVTGANHKTVQRDVAKPKQAKPRQDDSSRDKCRSDRDRDRGDRRRRARARRSPEGRERRRYRALLVRSIRTAASGRLHSGKPV